MQSQNYGEKKMYNELSASICFSLSKDSLDRSECCYFDACVPKPDQDFLYI